jgi:ligand-binding SRPBCC domain-containing protein
MIKIARSSSPGTYLLTSEVKLPAHIDKVFAFFSDASQLERLTPDWLRFSVLTPLPIKMEEGTLIDYRLRVHGVPLRWRSRICRWDPPDHFADEQLHGPYRRWYHSHTFQQDGEETLCRDDVEYSFIGGPLIHSLFVKRDLQRIFHYRIQVLREIFARNAHISQ